MNMDQEIQRAIAIGEASKEIIELAQNWCAHLVVERSPLGGVGMVEQATGLPIGMRHIRCPYARAAGIAGMDLHVVALDFYDRNCVGCNERRPVRLPNLLQLVARRDQALERQEEYAQLAAQEETEQIEARASRRGSLREGVDGPRAGIFDLVDRLDRAPTDADRQVLLETIHAAADQFDAALQEALFDLADAGGWIRTEAALEALDEVTIDRIRLTNAALRALARGDSIRVAGPIVSRAIDASQRDLLPPAVPALISLASPQHSAVFDMPGLSGDPAPLLAAYRVFPEIIYGGIRDMLRVPDKHSRFEACYAAAIIDVDPDFGVKVAGELIRSLRLPDDDYDEGSAGDAVVRALALAMRTHVAAIDALVQQALTVASEAESSTLFEVYLRLLKRAWDERQHPVTPADELAFRRIVDVLTQRPVDQRLRMATQFVRDEAHYYPRLLAERADVLLGAAALIAADLEDRYSPLVDPRPDAHKALEASTRQIRLEAALYAVAQAVGWAALQQPYVVGRSVIQTLDRLEERHEPLKAALVRCLGIMGRNHDGLPVTLPALYTALMDPSPRVRREAATAYGELAANASEDLPSLVHESFLVLLRDPYVVVHSAAIDALRRVQLPTRFLANALNHVMTLIAVYTASRSDDRLLSECIERFMDLCNQKNILSPELLQMIVMTVTRMEPSVAARIVKYRRWKLRAAPGFADMAVKLLVDPETYEEDLKDLAEELAEASQEDICRLGHAIQEAAAACIRRRISLADNFLAILTTAGLWSAAVAIARQAAEQREDTRWARPQKLRAQARQVAAELELAAASGQTTQVLACCARWRELQQEIQRDWEENEESRSPSRGLRFPPPSE
jgi:hypothetical protein